MMGAVTREGTVLPLEAGPAQRARWVLFVAALGGFAFTVGLLVEVRCAVGRCPGPGVRRLFLLDGLGSLPRSFTTLVFGFVAVLAVLAWRRSTGRARWWWVLITGGGIVLALAKAVSAHSTVEHDDGAATTLVGAVIVTVVGLLVLWWTGLRWSVPGASPVTAAMAAYAAAALGLDQVTGAIATASANPVVWAFAVYVEEGGEAVTALVLLAAVVRSVPARR
jgi:hypothetical protein